MTAWRGEAHAVVYGPDDRQDIYQVAGEDWKPLLADSAVALMWTSDVVLTWNGSEYDFDPNVATLADWYAPLCPGERYGSQPSAAYCSGFLVGPDLIMTAGHCIRNSPDCADTTFVFGFWMEDANTPVSQVGEDDVYQCSSIVSRMETSTNDFALIQVDRPVAGHNPLPLRRVGAVESDPEVTELLLIGHPVGLPMKIAGGAAVKASSHSEYFEANVDSFGGNSGSGVAYGGNGGSGVLSLDEMGNILLVEGILVRGYTDYVDNGTCYETNVCSDETGCGGSWQEVTRITNLSALVPPLEPPGCVPDGSAVPGSPLSIVLEPSGEVTLSWDLSTVPTDDYEIYEGTVGDFASHQPLFCSTGGLTSLTIAPAPTSTYYLAVARNGYREGSYGWRGDGSERPQSGAACLHQEIGVCP
jgi:hypothetical protein